jgi:formate dehydrogenase maturation protein FdhE
LIRPATNGEVSIKKCSVCGDEKPHTEFHKVRANGRVYPQGRCKPCNTAYMARYRVSNRDKVRQIVRDSVRRAQSDPVRARKRLHAALRFSFGIGVEDYDRMVFEQGGACAICGCTPSIGMAKTGSRRKHSRLCVDHDHTTGKVRGLLCHDCNTGIGFMRDSADSLRRAATYLDKHK